MNNIATLLNNLAKRLGGTRKDALKQLAELGWPTDIYYHGAWYPDLGKRSRLLRSGLKNPNRAERLRESVIEVDQALISIDYFSQISEQRDSDEDIESLLIALDSSINAITAILTPDAEIGKRQRASGHLGGSDSERLKEIRRIHREWLKEDDRLRRERPSLSASDRARNIATQHAKRYPALPKPSWETIRQAVRKTKKAGELG